MRLKDVSICNPNYTGPDRDDSVAFVPMESLRYNAIDQQEISFADGKGKYTYFADGDLLFAKVTPCFENGNIAVAKGLKGGIGFGSSEIFVLRACRHVTSEYLFYIAQGSPFRDGAIATMSGVGGLKRIDPLFTKTFEFDVPSLNAQQRIVNYLDEKTAAIDGKVAVLEKKLAAYKRLKKSVINRAVTRGLDPNVKLKDSCVDWIGQVPEGWKIWRGKDVMNLKTDVLPGGRKIGLENIEGFSGRFLQTNSEFEGEGPRFEVGNIVYGKLRPYLCKVWLAEFNGTAVGDLFVYAVSDALVAKYYFYTMLSSSFTSVSNAATYGTKMPRVSAQYIDNLGFPVPPCAEQQAIADYLDTECAKIDRVAEIVTREIDAYKRLKRSLINEVVTGKRKVA